MTKKKQPNIPITQADNEQAQHLLEQYHEIANNLHKSTDQKQAETALSEINEMPEGGQMALLKALSKEPHTDAADVLIAINEMSPIKNVRKEAKRSLIRLEGARIYPKWRPPIDRTPVVQITTTPLHFWQGFVTDTLSMDQAQLLLCFHEQEDSKSVRILGFLLEFTHDGIKDFFTRVQSKQVFDDFLAETNASMPGVKLKPCSLAQGRRLIMDALAVNQEHGTLPYKDYRLNISLVNSLVLDAAGIEEEEEFDEEFDEDEEESINIHDLDPKGVVINFVEPLTNGNFGIAYDLLSNDSPLREGLSKDEWIERREAWADEANPDELVPNFIHELEPNKSKLWLPNPFSASRSANRKEIEAGWSFELDETPLSGTLPELPQPTAIYEETGRQWFWASYTVVQEDDEWRIQSMTDEGTNAQGLSIAELQKRIQELDTYLQEFTKKHKPAEIAQLSDDEAGKYMEEVLWYVMKATYYTDALIKKMPLDRTNYEDAAGRMIVFGQYERSIVYLEALTQRFTEQRAMFLRQLAAVQGRLSGKYYDEGDDERAERCEDLAIEALRESLGLEDSFEAHISLAEFLIDKKEELDEAEDHLLRAKAQITAPSDEAHIELHLGEIATEREQYMEALKHYQRVVELVPDSPQSWFDLGETHQKLKNYEEAAANYERAIELEPDNEDYYYILSKLYAEKGEPERAIEAIEEGINNNPDSAVLNIYLATTYFDNGDYRQAEIFLEHAERIDPEAPYVGMFREMLALSKPRPTPAVPRLGGPKKKKRGR